MVSYGCFHPPHDPHKIKESMGNRFFFGFIMINWRGKEGKIVTHESAAAWPLTSMISVGKGEKKKERAWELAKK